MSSVMYSSIERYFLSVKNWRESMLCDGLKRTIFIEAQFDRTMVRTVASVAIYLVCSL